MSAVPVITYWNGRGRAEFIRLMFAAAGVPFKSGPFLKQPEDIEKLRKDGKLKFDQVPLVELDGLNMVQAGAVARYIARKHNLYGKTDLDRYHIDLLTEGTRDFLGPFMGFGFSDDAEIIKNAKAKTIPRYMSVFEKEVSDGRKYLVADQLTMADVGLLECLLHVEERMPEVFGDYPKLKAYYDQVKNVSQIAAYLTGPQRPRPNDAEYIAEVRRTLGW